MNKGAAGRYQDSKDSSRDGTSKYLKDGYRSSRDQYPSDGYSHIRTCHTEIATIERTKKFDKWAQKANPLDKESERRFF